MPECTCWIGAVQCMPLWFSKVVFWNLCNFEEVTKSWLSLSIKWGTFIRVFCGLNTMPLSKRLISLPGILERLSEPLFQLHLLSPTDGEHVVHDHELLSTPEGQVIMIETQWLCWQEINLPAFPGCLMLGYSKLSPVCSPWPCAVCGIQNAILPSFLLGKVTVKAWSGRKLKMKQFTQML